MEISQSLRLSLRCHDQQLFAGEAFHDQSALTSGRSVVRLRLRNARGNATRNKQHCREKQWKTCRTTTQHVIHRTSNYKKIKMLFWDLNVNTQRAAPTGLRRPSFLATEAR